MFKKQENVGKIPFETEEAIYTYLTDDKNLIQPPYIKSH